MIVCKFVLLFEMRILILMFFISMVFERFWGVGYFVYLVSKVGYWC